MIESFNNEETKADSLDQINEYLIAIAAILNSKNQNVDIITIGQYLQPSKKHLPVKEFITPEQFEKYEKIGKEMGFRHVESGALVRSSYHAEKHIL
jgi:lipoic acid synthetase